MSPESVNPEKSIGPIPTATAEQLAAAEARVADMFEASAPRNVESLADPNLDEHQKPVRIQVIEGVQAPLSQWEAPAPSTPKTEVAEPGYEAGFDDNPFAVGEDIIVKRNANNETGAPEYNESGWKIVEDDIKVEAKAGSKQYVGALKVQKVIDGELYDKIIRTADVYALNPRETAPSPELAEKVPLTEGQEDLADEAIEEALGLEDPQDIDTVDHEVLADQATIEAAQRVSGMEQPSSSELELEELNHHIEEIHQSLNKMVEDFSVTDRTAVWRFATSINYGEEDRAKRSLSYKFEENNPSILRKYKEAFVKLRELRNKADVLKGK